MTAPLLVALRRRGVKLTRSGVDMVVEYPRGVLAPEERQALTAAKAEILSHLDLEAKVLALSLAEFERQQRVIEAVVPGFDKTLWFVPTEAHARRLVEEGVSRGCIWTAIELRSLPTLDDPTQVSFVQIARLKAEFGAEIVGIVGGDEKPRHV